MRHAAMFSGPGTSQELRLALSAKRINASAQDESVVTRDRDLSPGCAFTELIHPTRGYAGALGNFLRCQRATIMPSQQATRPGWESIKFGEKRAHFLFFGLPPFLPFSRTARRFAGLRDNPPIRPRTLAAFLTDGGTGITLATLNLSELVVNDLIARLLFTCAD